MCRLDTHVHVCYDTLSNLTHRNIFYSTSTHHTSSHPTARHPTSADLTLPHLGSSYPTPPHFDSSCFTSPHRQTPHLHSSYPTPPHRKTPHLCSSDPTPPHLSSSYSTPPHRDPLHACKCVTLTLSARFSSQSPSEKALKSPVLLGLSGGLVGGLVGPCPLLEFTGLDAEGASAAALKARARCCGCFLGVRLGCIAKQSQSVRPSSIAERQRNTREGEECHAA